MPAKNKNPAKAKVAQHKNVKTAAKTKKRVVVPSFWARNKFAITGALFVAIAAVTGSIMIFKTDAAATTQQVVSGVSSSKCLDDAYGAARDENKIQLYQCNGSVAQQWQLNSNGTITNVNGYCLDVRGAGTSSGTLVWLYHCNGTVAQQWMATNGTLVNPHSKLCLDDQYSQTVDGNQVWVWTCNGTKAQQWTFTTASSSNPTPTPTPTPPSSSDPSGQAMPVGNLTGWRQVFADDFLGNVPLGAFSDCDHNTDTPQAYCGGLKSYASYYKNWWAYPNTWPDTAKSGADGNGGAPFGGTYHPEDTVSVNSGAMHIHMYRPTSGGDNHVAAVVPRACMNQEYGRYVERFKVVHADPGFKSAHLFYQGGYEIDYPENDYGTTISAYTHPGGASFDTNTSWTGWHTTVIEWTASSVKFYMDGKLVGNTSTKVPHLKMSWILQNESSILGPYAKPGASSQMDIDWVTCYAQS